MVRALGFIGVLACAVACGSADEKASAPPPDVSDVVEDIAVDVPDTAPLDVPEDSATIDVPPAPEVSVSDTSDTTADLPPQSGEACAQCTTDEDCVDGICAQLAGTEILYCSRKCLDGCPPGFGCESFLQGACTPDVVGGVACQGDASLVIENVCGHQYETPCPQGVACNPTVCQEFGETANCIQTQSADGSSCKCNATCQGGVCGGGVPADSDCVGIINCIAVFDNPADCLDVCTLAASPQSKQDFETFTACIGGCGFAENIQTCVAEQCFSEMQQCMHEGLSGSETCGGIAACVEGCAGVWSCGQSCIESGTLVAQEMFYLMQNCLIDACGTYPSTACADEASAGICATKITTCFDQ